MAFLPEFEEKRVRRKKKFPTFFFFLFVFFVNFFRFFDSKKKKKRFLRWIKDAMIVSFLKQVLKLFWDNCKWAVLSHLLEKNLHFFALFVQLFGRGQVFFYFQLSTTDWVCVSADFLILESNDNINTFLTSYYTLLFIPSNFMEGFAFLIDDTSYICTIDDSSMYKMEEEYSGILN